MQKAEKVKPAQDIFTSTSLKNNPILQTTMGQFDKLFPKGEKSKQVGENIEGKK